VRLKVPLPHDEPRCPTISDVYAGANWHEREAAEMFGIEFDGHPQPVKLLLPEPFEGHPLRKDFALMSRVAKPWPGSVEGEEDEEE
jgi:NADH-quinone oxidoreductase subunit C